MASAFEINGPTAVQLKVSPIGGSWVELGRSDGEELISFDTQILGKEIFSDEKGMVPDEILHLGMRGLLTMQLVKWDRLVLDSLWGTVPRAAVTGDIHLHQGTVGERWSDVSVATIGFFGIRVAAELTDTRIVRSFNRCYLLGDDAIREADIGNNRTALRLSFHVLPDTLEDLYTSTVTS